MAKPARKSSPILGAVATMIGEASDTLVTNAGRFRHSFELDVAAISPDPDQARKSFDPAEIAGLASTMAEQGQLQPILVRRDPADRRRFVLIAGERRWRAAQSLGWTSILAIEHNGDPGVTALIENLQRVDLSPIEEARGLARLIAHKGWSQDKAAAVLGKAKSEVSATLKLLSLPEPLLEKILTSDRPIAKNVLVEIARIEDPARREALIAAALQGGVTVRRVREAAAEIMTPAMRAQRAVQSSLRLVQIARVEQPEVPMALRQDLARLRDEIDRLLG